MCVQALDDKIRELESVFYTRFARLEQFVNTYFQFKLILEEIRQSTQHAIVYLENLRTELNMLSLNHLSPSRISPKNLRELLLDIRNKLPASMKLPADPVNNIWYFYKTITYTTLPHHLIKDKLSDLINRTFIRENTQYLACNEECAFFTSDVYNNHNLWSCQKVCDALVYLLDNICIRFGTKLYRQTIGIPMGTNCAPLVADLFLFCYERDFMKSLMKSLSRENQADIIEAFNLTSRYLDDLLNIDNIYFDQMVDRIYPTELQLNRANSSDTEASFLDLNLCISNGTISTKIYHKRDDFDFDIVNFPFLDGDVPRRTSYGVYISQLIKFARASSNLNDFNYRNKALSPNFIGRAIVILNFVRRFRNFIADTVPLL